MHIRMIGVFLLGLALMAVVGFAGAHAPITILGNSDFTAANGVVGGKGTAADPYIIAGWEINVPQTASYAVNIQNTTAHFVLRGLIIRGALDPLGAAIHLGFVSGATIEGCTISNSLNGIDISSSTAITMKMNVLYVQGMGLRVIGESPAEYNLAIDTTNMLNNAPIHYIYGQHGGTVSGIKGTCLYVAASDGVTIENNTIVNGDGIQLAFVTNSIIRNNEARRTSPVYTEHGLTLYRSDNNTVTNNVLVNNRFAGLFLWLSKNNTVTGNQLMANNFGALVAASDNNVISDNAIAANPTGIQLSAGSTGNKITQNIIYQKNTKYGIAIGQATGNIITQNSIAEAETGISISKTGTDNTVSFNTIVAGAYGVEVTGSYNTISHNLIAQQSQGILFPETYGKVKVVGNVIRDNVFSENQKDLYLNKDSEANMIYGNYFLDTGKAVVEDYGNGNAWTQSGVGNYWATYTGKDTDKDGIGDTPMTVYPSTAQDTAPIMTTAGAAGDLGVLSALKKETITLTTKAGKKISVTALAADKPYSRFTGFRGFPPSLRTVFPAILFSFTQEVKVQFTMETVHFPIDIVFFDKSGKFAGGTTMKVYTANAKKKQLYTAKGAFQYALELPQGFITAHGIGDGTVLTLPGSK